MLYDGEEKGLAWLPTLQGTKSQDGSLAGGFYGRAPLLFSTICFILQMSWSQFLAQEMATEGREELESLDNRGGNQSSAPGSSRRGFRPCCGTAK